MLDIFTPVIPHLFWGLFLFFELIVQNPNITDRIRQTVCEAYEKNRTVTAVRILCKFVLEKKKKNNRFFLTQFENFGL